MRLRELMVLGRESPSGVKTLGRSFNMMLDGDWEIVVSAPSGEPRASYPPKPMAQLCTVANSPITGMRIELVSCKCFGSMASSK
jgi:hypothetical protein